MRLNVFGLEADEDGLPIVTRLEHRMLNPNHKNFLEIARRYYDCFKPRFKGILIIIEGYKECFIYNEHNFRT